jgi:CubicO group peptidase (beta-lactamase class C family)
MLKRTLALTLPLALITAGTADAHSWKKVSPGSVGLDAKKLGQIADTAKTGKSNCLLVARDGKLADEWYWHGTNKDTTQDVYSVTKSFTSTLVGIAQDEGDLRITDPAAKYIPAWKGTPASSVTIRDLLSMDSGRQWSFESDYVQLLKAPDQTAYATGLTQSSAPGQTWTYNNAAVQTLEQVLRAATGESVATFAQEKLFKPLGMTHTKMSADKAGHALMYEGIRSTCRDMARFGEAMLDKGKPIVSSGWVGQATAHSSTKLNAGYGYLWWLNHEGTLASPFTATSLTGAKDQKKAKGRIVKGAPSDLFWALGLGNQLVQVDPGTRTVVVRLGSAEPNPKPPTFGPAEASKVVTEAVER